VFLARKRIAWDACLDMPVGLASRQAPGIGMPMTMEIILGERTLGYPGPFTAGIQQGWLVVLTIANPGFAPVRGADFSAPLTFTFPGRQIHATQISAAPAARNAGRPLQPPAVHASAGTSREPGPPGSRAARLQVTGDFLLRPGDGCTVMVILSGTLPGDARRIQQEGSLASGKIIPAIRR
jgi:hypothetical protein